MRRLPRQLAICYIWDMVKQILARDVQLKTDKTPWWRFRRPSILRQHTIYFDIGRPSQAVDRYPGGLAKYISERLGRGVRPSGINHLSTLDNRRYLQLHYRPSLITEQSVLEWVSRVFG